MQTTRKLLLLALVGVLPLAACAETPYRPYDNAQWDNHRWVPSEHPYYLHAMSDLRLARAYLAHPGNEAVNDDERAALRAIDAVLGEMWHAAISDGKNPDWQAPIDANLHGADRFHMAMQLLNKARQDASHAEEDPWARQLQGRILAHIDEARQAAGRAFQDAQNWIPPMPGYGGEHHWRPDQHPYYLHAMSDLRAARAYLARPGNDAVRDDERFAIGEIDAALGEMWHAAISDGKDPQWQMPVDSTLHGADRLHKAIELLDQARRDAIHQENDPSVHDLQQRIVHHINEATRATVQA